MMEVVAIYDEEDEEAEENDLDFESDWEEQKDSLTTSSFQKSQMEKYEENLMKEVEQLLEPIERAILQQSAIPNLEKLSTGKFYELYELDAEICHKELDLKMSAGLVCLKVGLMMLFKNWLLEGIKLAE